MIELLIVVAIIAILAAIATPNFLNAQMRAKVVRARSDMRTLIVGIESYAVDHNAYPCDGQTAGCRWYWATAAHVITTPVAYISDIPPDAFVQLATSGSADYWYVSKKGYGSFSRTRDVFPRRNVRLFDPPRDVFEYGFISVGPDREWEWCKGGRTDFPQFHGDVNYYDVTNGVRSEGDLYQYGPGNAYNPPSNWAR